MKGVVRDQDVLQVCIVKKGKGPEDVERGCGMV